MSKKPRITKAQKKVLSSLKNGRSIMISRHDGEVCYAFSDGAPVNLRTATLLIERGLLHPVGDGMFGDTQSWVAA